IPHVLERCLSEIEARGLTEVGLYRVPGSGAGVSRLRSTFDSGQRDFDMGRNSEFSDINIVGGAVKLFLREMPEPLLTHNLYDAFIKAVSIEDYDERLWAIKDLVHALPRPNYIVLRRVIEHLEKVTDYEDVNNMFSTNLAIVFGPTLLQ
ncbi:RhoGAP-domain-containing protein, partial [Ramicandelaber brevisporus]